MAIINSLAIGKSVKSAGNLTYKTVRGRTIASQRITTNKSNTMAQATQRSNFGYAAQAAQLIQVFIDNCYEKSQYGSARNNFMHLNKKYYADGLIGEVKEGIVPLVDVFIPAFTPDRTNPRGSYIDWSAYGSSSIIVRETFAKAVYTNGDTSGSYNETSAVEYSFITPVAREKAKIVMCGLIGTDTDGLTKAMLTSRSFTLSDVDITTIGEFGFQIDVNEDSAGNVLSFRVSVGTPTHADNYEAYAVIFPVVGGKIPKLKGWLHVDVESVP